MVYMKLKGKYGGSSEFIVRLFKSKNRKNYSTFGNETTSKLKVLPQGENFGRDL